MLDDMWQSDNITRRVGDGASTLFWKDPGLVGVTFDVRYARLFYLVVNKLFTVAEIFSLGWASNGVVGECADQLSLVVL